MALELVKDSLVTEQIVGQDKYQALVSYDVVLNDVKPDIDKILSVSAMNNLLKREVTQGRVMIEGMLDCNVLYTANTDKIVDYMQVKIPYTEYVDIIGAEPKMTCYVYDAIDSTDAEIINSRKVGIKIVLDFDIKVAAKNDMEITTDVLGLDDLQSLKKSINLTSMVGSGVSQNIVKEDLEIPQNKLDVKEILKYGINIVPENVVVAEDNVTVDGRVLLKIVYYTDVEEHPIDVASFELPFAQVIDVPGSKEGMDATVQFYIDDTNFKLLEDGEGKIRIMDTEILIKAYAIIKQTEKREALVDLYSPGQSTILSNNTYKYKNTITENRTIQEIRNTLDLSIPATTIFETEARPIISSWKADSDRIIGEGEIQFSEIYMAASDDANVVSDIQQIPFYITIDSPGAQTGMSTDIIIEGFELDYELKNPEQLNVNIKLSLKSSVYENDEVNIVTKVEESEEELPPTPSITVYMVQKNDDLWDIAKKHMTTIDDILDINGIQKEDISTGMKLIIPKRIVVKPI